MSGDREKQPEAKSGDTASGVELTPGERVRLCIPTGPCAGSYSGLVVDQSLEHLVLSACGQDWPADYLSLGTGVTIGFPAAEGWGEFQSRVNATYMRGSIVQIMLSRPGRIVYRQRRLLPRLAAELRLYAWPAEGEDPSGQMTLGQAEDISRCGLRAHFNQPLNFEGPVLLAISPGQSLQETRLIADRAWYEATGEPEREWHRYGFRFSEMTPEARHRLHLLLALIRAREAGHRAPRPDSARRSQMIRISWQGGEVS